MEDGVWATCKGVLDNGYSSPDFLQREPSKTTFRCRVDGGSSVFGRFWF
jgi:hypothetical protein